MVFSTKSSSIKRDMDVLGGILTILKHKNNLRSPSLLSVLFQYTLKLSITNSSLFCVVQDNFPLIPLAILLSIHTN